MRTLLISTVCAALVPLKIAGLIIIQLCFFLNRATLKLEFYFMMNQFFHANKHKNVTVKIMK
jgi:hypothetical protein